MCLGQARREEESTEDVRNCCYCFGLSAWLTGRKEARSFPSLDARWARRIFKN